MDKKEEFISDLGHWHAAFPIPSDTFGFIYLITNKKNGRKYLGKKQMIFKKSSRNKKKTRKYVKFVPSDWKTYTGSCEKLNVDIKKEGIAAFDFEIMCLCESKWQLTYTETLLQLLLGVLMRDDFYNGFVACKLGRGR